MNILSNPKTQSGQRALSPDKFKDPNKTAKGEPRASVAFEGFKTLWFFTGSLCNIECVNCYIESSPSADHFVYLTPQDIEPFLHELADMSDTPIEIGFTGGEPFMNPHIITLCEMVLARGHRLLVLTNGMRPMMRPRVQRGLLALQSQYRRALTLRVSLDHYKADLHDEVRGTGSFKRAVKGLDWLSEHGFHIDLAGRTIWKEDDATSRAGYAQLVRNHGWPIDTNDPARLVLFPEMDDMVDVPEITTACWDILGKSPSAIMCSSSRMVVKRKGAKAASVLACTLLWDDPQFEFSPRLQDALAPIKLNHPHCAKFCVLGGASCSV